MEIVYVLTNPVMPGLVKIGKTTRTIAERLHELDRTGVPVPFECVAAWTFRNADGVEKVLHEAFADSRVRKNREFFRISPYRPIAILEKFGDEDVTPRDDVVDEKNADDDRASLDAARLRRENFSFDKVGIKRGETLHWARNDEVTCKVVDEKKVRFGNEVTSLSDAALKVFRAEGKIRKAASGPESWLYKGTILARLRDGD